MPNNTVQISIIIPTYNYGQYVTKAVYSVLNQQDPNFEIIVVDDGSEDNTAQLIKELQKEYPIIQYIYQKNQGLATTRNTGIVAAAGDYLVFLDADDQLVPNGLSYVRKAITEHPNVDVIFAGQISVHPNGTRKLHRQKPLSDDRLKNFVGYLRKKYSFSNGASFFHKRVFEKIKYPSHLRINEDLAVFAQVLALYDCISIPEPVLEVYKHADSLRNNILYNKKVGLQSVDAIFDPKILPEEFLAFKNEYYAQRYLALFRGAYLAKEYKNANHYYCLAIKTCPKMLGQGTYLKKYFFSVFKRIFKNE